VLVVAEAPLPAPVQGQVVPVSVEVGVALVPAAAERIRVARIPLEADVGRSLAVVAGVVDRVVVVVVVVAAAAVEMGVRRVMWDHRHVGIRARVGPWVQVLEQGGSSLLL